MSGRTDGVLESSGPLTARVLAEMADLLGDGVMCVADGEELDLPTRHPSGPGWQQAWEQSGRDWRVLQDLAQLLAACAHALLVRERLVAAGWTPPGGAA